MRVKYFSDTDTAHIEFTDKTIQETKEISENIYVEDITKLLNRRFIKLKNGDELEPLEIQMRRKDGSTVWISSHTSMVDLESENFIQILLQDITERKESELKLRESEEKYRDLFDKSPNAIILMDFLGELRDCNLRTFEMFGLGREDIEGKSLEELDIIPPESFPIVMQNFRDLTKGEIPESIETILYKNDGSPFWAYTQHSTITIDNEELIQLIVQDITELKEAEVKIKESEEKYRNLFENTPFSILILDSHARVIDVNSAIVELKK